MTLAGTAGGAIGGTAGQWAGGALGGVLGSIIGPEGTIAGALIGRRLGGLAGSWAGRTAGEWAANHMSNANDEADKGAQAQGAPIEACATCKQPLKPPNRRHDPCRVKPNDPTKENNSMIDPDHADQVGQDIQDIIGGKVPKQGEDWAINGRTYSQHNGSVFPKSGPGIVQLPNRMQHQLLGQLNTNSYSNAMKFADNLIAKGLMTEEEFKQVMDLWKKCPKNTS